MEGLSPTIAIDQKTASVNPRSTVGTITEIYDYLRLLYARLGTIYCHHCGTAISRQTPAQILDQILDLKVGARLQILTPVVLNKKGSHSKQIEGVGKANFELRRNDGSFYNNDEAKNLSLDKNLSHTIEILLDTLTLTAEAKSKAAEDPTFQRLQKNITTALLSDGFLHVYLPETDVNLEFNLYYICRNCGATLQEIEPRSFLFTRPALVRIAAVWA
jgi:excinuclease ABC subunit A